MIMMTAASANSAAPVATTTTTAATANPTIDPASVVFIAITSAADIATFSTAFAATVVR